MPTSADSSATMVLPVETTGVLQIVGSEGDARLWLPTDAVGLRMTLTRLGPASWRADFSRPVLRTPVLLWVGAYSFSPALDVLGVSAAAGASVSSVELATSEQGPADYTLTAYGVEVADAA